MKKTLLTLAAAAACTLAWSSPAHAQLKVRLGGELPIVYHDSNLGTHALTDANQLTPSLTGMLGLTLLDVVSLDGEIAEQFWANPPPGGSSRIGTTVSVGATFSPPVIPFYVRAALPFQIENSGGGPKSAGLRAGAGTLIGLGPVHLYLEGLVDFPLFSLSSGPTGQSHSAFDTQTFSLGAGLQFNL